jgi:immunoglobulin heavy chain
VKVSCKALGCTFTSYDMYWVKQATGKGLQNIGWINTKNGSTGYGEGFKGWFVISMVASVSTTYLQIRSLKAEDTALYYCARHSVKTTS